MASAEVAAAPEVKWAQGHKIITPTSEEEVNVFAMTVSIAGTLENDSHLACCIHAAGRRSFATAHNRS
jgi:hypothetical protein